MLAGFLLGSVPLSGRLYQHLHAMLGFWTVMVMHEEPQPSRLVHGVASKRTLESHIVGPCACRQSTRSRFKLIPRVANVEQWARDAPLSTPEYKLLRNYNDKPVLTRPQQRWGPILPGTLLFPQQQQPACMHARLCIALSRARLDVSSGKGALLLLCSPQCCVLPCRCHVP